MKFCFFGNISEALKGKTPGGGELQIALLATALALKKHDVVIVDPASKESFVTKEGVRVINLPNWNKGMRGLRLLTYRMPALKKLLIDQHADYYYLRMRSYLNLIPYLALRKTKGKLIVGIAHDLDVSSFRDKFVHEYWPKFNLGKFLGLYLPSDFVFDYILRRADHITVQHSGQHLNPRKIRGKVSVYPNIFDRSNVPIVEHPSRDYFVHVGTLTILKGADKLYELITSLDKKNVIVIVGQPKDSASKKIYAELNKSSNVILKGRLSHADTMQLIANAKALINTSNFEGFPNIFLEAWSTGVPVISLGVNPGGIIDKYHLGVCCGGNLDRMKSSIESNETCGIDRDRLISYVSEFHDFDRAADRFLSILN